MLIRISYPLETGSPLYPGTPPPSIADFRSMRRGDSSSSSTVTFHTHSGTHVDAPGHFCPGGGSVADHLGREALFSPIMILDLPKSGDACITPGDLSTVLPDLKGMEALLVRTGSHRLREEDPDGYAALHPWIHPDVPGLLRRHGPSLRLFGVDAISVSSPAHRDEGGACHRAFLCPSPPLLLLEDVDLSDPRLAGSGWGLRVYPWLHEPLDGVPVVALAERGTGP